MGNIAILKENVHVVYCRKDEILPMVVGSIAVAMNLYIWTAMKRH
jgi:hypothetical protein